MKPIAQKLAYPLLAITLILAGCSTTKLTKNSSNAYDRAPAGEMSFQEKIDTSFDIQYFLIDPHGYFSRTSGVHARGFQFSEEQPDKVAANFATVEVPIEKYLRSMRNLANVAAGAHIDKIEISYDELGAKRIWLRITYGGLRRDSAYVGIDLP
jgi:hypothetical protein